MDIKTCYFIGDADVPENILETIQKRLEDEVVSLIRQGVRKFCVYGGGGFGALAARVVSEIGKYYPRVRLSVSRGEPRGKKGICVCCPVNYDGAAAREAARAAELGMQVVNLAAG